VFGVMVGVIGRTASPQRARNAVLNGAPDTIRTCDLGLRSPLLYPTELRAHGAPPAVVFYCSGLP
jgi:hypothetical protein